MVRLRRCAVCGDEFPVEAGSDPIRCVFCDPMAHPVAVQARALMMRRRLERQARDGMSQRRVLGPPSSQTLAAAVRRVSMAESTGERCLALRELAAESLAWAAALDVVG